MKKIIAIVVLPILLMLSKTAFSATLYHFYGYDNCPLLNCSAIATGTLFLPDNFNAGTGIEDVPITWKFTNQITGASYSTGNPHFNVGSGQAGYLPQESGVAYIWLDFVGDHTLFYTGNHFQQPGLSKTFWAHEGIEPLFISNYYDLIANIPVSGQHHKWVRYPYYGEVSEPSVFLLFLIGILALLVFPRYLNARSNTGQPTVLCRPGK